MQFISKFRSVWPRREKRNEFESAWLRGYSKHTHDVRISLYSCSYFDPKRVPSVTVIGRHCSLAAIAQLFSANHGLSLISLHPYMYKANLGLVEEEAITTTRCVLEDNVWLGHGSIVLRSVSVVGRGAVFGAVSVVTRDVPRYAVFAGNPAKLIRYRFSEEAVDQIEATEWWLMTKFDLREKIKETLDVFHRPTAFFNQC